MQRRVKQTVRQLDISRVLYINVRSRSSVFIKGGSGTQPQRADAKFLALGFDPFIMPDCSLARCQGYCIRCDAYILQSLLLGACTHTHRHTNTQAHPLKQ